MSKDCQSHGKQETMQGRTAARLWPQTVKCSKYSPAGERKRMLVQPLNPDLHRGTAAASRGFPRWDFHQPAGGSSAYTETQHTVKLHVQKLVCLLGNKEDRCCIVSHLPTSWSTLNYSQLRTSAKGKEEEGVGDGAREVERMNITKHYWSQKHKTYKF